MTTKGTTTLRLPEERLKVIRAIAGFENRSLTDNCDNSAARLYTTLLLKINKPVNIAKKL